jgi:RHS repeat-associated protein
MTASDYRYTGQREESEIGLYFYQARFYDAALARFIQADTIVPQPGDIKSYDRYAYVYNNPINYNDPTGHMACDEYGNCFNNHEYWNINGQTDFSISYQAQILIFGAGYGNGGGLSDKYQSDSYNSLVEIVNNLGYVPSIKMILGMTVMSEYYIYANYNGGKAGELCQEAIARNYYTWCKAGKCNNNSIFGFMSGFEPWFKNYKSDGENISSEIRADYLINRYYGFTGDKEVFTKHISEILGPKEKGWELGKVGNRPWQFFGPLIPIEGTNPKFGSSVNDTAIISVDIGNGYYFWIFTADQTYNFKKDLWIIGGQ